MADLDEKSQSGLYEFLHSNVRGRLVCKTRQGAQQYFLGADRILNDVLNQFLCALFTDLPRPNPGEMPAHHTSAPSFHLMPPLFPSLPLDLSELTNVERKEA